MITAISRKIRSYLGKPVTSRYPLEPTEANMMAAMESGKCFYCGGTKWYEGPSGGMSQNLLCGGCGQKVNYSMVTCEDIGFDPALRQLHDWNPNDKRDWHGERMAGRA